MVRTARCVTLAKMNSRNSVNSVVAIRSMPYATRIPNGNTSIACGWLGVIVMLSINAFSTSGTPTLASLAPTKNSSAKITRHLYTHK